MVMFWRILRHRPLRQLDHRGDVADAAVQHGGIGRLQRHVGAAAHGDADIGGRQRRRVVDAVADLGDRRAPRACSSPTMRCLSSGSSSARTSMPSCRPIAAAVRWLSPVSMTVLDAGIASAP